MESCTLQLQSWRPFQLDCDSPNSKRPCHSDRATSFSIDMSKLSLFDDDKPLVKRWFPRKRRRRGGSRSVSGRSSDRRCCSVGANGTCSDFPMAAGTDSSGELFVNGGGEVNWASDVSEVARNSRREREGNVVDGQFGNFDGLGNESGYGSEPGYRGDVELGYGDEVEEEEDDPRLLFWGKELFGDNSSRVGENSMQKLHHRGRRKKNDLRMVDALR
ncbi:uncharacterized protein [Henckelia pumila]|uniref:uncharacterized protein isoform X2 n=1 Tax=Henckelia pumila TaxID=405737 RepID=UPI003C6E77CC